jgi:hypothetical protein
MQDKIMKQIVASMSGITRICVAAQSFVAPKYYYSSRPENESSSIHYAFTEAQISCYRQKLATLSRRKIKPGQW